MSLLDYLCFFFFFNATATTEIYTLSLHDALPIYEGQHRKRIDPRRACAVIRPLIDRAKRNERKREQQNHSRDRGDLDRKSTRLNSSHSQISYAVFCLKKKKKTNLQISSN